MTGHPREAQATWTHVGRHLVGHAAERRRIEAATRHIEFRALTDAADLHRPPVLDYLIEATVRVYVGELRAVGWTALPDGRHLLGLAGLNGAGAHVLVDCNNAGDICGAALAFTVAPGPQPGRAA